MSIEKDIKGIKRAELRTRVEGLYEQTKALLAMIETMQVPVGHGTASEFIHGILSDGLGANMPDKALHKTKSLTALHTPDGLTGAYLFAKTGLEHTLSFERQTVSGIDMFDRYEQLNTRFPAAALRQQLHAYMERKQPQGYPVVLIYEGATANIRKMNPSVPSELAYEGVISSDTLKIMLAPKDYLSDALQSLSHFGISAVTMPIEACELM